MIIGIRKEPNGSLYIDNEIERFGEDLTIYTLPPYNYTLVKLDETYKDCIGADFNEDLTFNPVKFSTRKTLELTARYEERVVELIRNKYSLNQELAILRQTTTKPAEYQEYFDFVENCKATAKAELGVL